MKTITELKRIKLALNGLVVLEEILEDLRIKYFCQLVEKICDSNFDCEDIYIAYHRFYKSMIGHSWKGYLVAKILDSEKAFQVLSGYLDNAEAKEQMIKTISRDLEIFQALAEVKPQEITALVIQRFQEQPADDCKELFTGSLCPENWPVWIENIRYRSEEIPKIEDISAAQWLKMKRADFIDKFINQKKWADNVSVLKSYYQQVGYGVFGQYGAFKLQASEQALEGIENPDPIQIGHLICQEREQKLVLHNTESFLQGYPANNIILYGNRGTGKSSLVKALLNAYVSKGLRLVQLKKNQIGSFPELVGELSKIPLKFIVFIDDLSFNDVEEDYKNLKSLLEGGVESRPLNVLVYATSNRRHLVKESFADRKGDDVHARDNMEETLSLADRFGITVTFLSPDQETYLKIVEGLAKQGQIDIDNDELRRRALKWVMMHNGRSGRTARQFIDHLTGEIALQCRSERL